MACTHYVPVQLIYVATYTSYVRTVGYPHWKYIDYIEHKFPYNFFCCSSIIYCIAGIHYESFNFVNFAIGNALAKLKLEHILLHSYIFYVFCCGYDIQKLQIFLLRAKIGPFAKISSHSKFYMV